MQNYKGETLEHVVCENMHHQIAEIMKLRPDIKDYYGALPLF
jgi:hypothetical protein